MGIEASGSSETPFDFQLTSLLYLQNIEILRSNRVVKALRYKPEGHGFKTDEVNACFQLT
jgi:hypothetical protein